MTDLYELLGLPRTASAKEIRHVGRKRLMDAHPDRGGDAEHFKALDRAYKVLSDPKRRAQYDATGTVDEFDKEQLDQQQVIRIVGQCLAASMAAALNAKKEPRFCDLVAAMLEAVQKGIDDGEDKIGKLLIEKARWQQLNGRFKSDIKDRKALLEDMIGVAVQNFDNNVKNLKQELAWAKMAHEFISGLRFTADAMEQFVKIMTVYTGAGTGSATGTTW